MRPKKCSLLAASSIDEYFAAVIDFVNWLYSDCGNSTTGQGSEDGKSQSKEQFVEPC